MTGNCSVAVAVLTELDGESAAAARPHNSALLYVDRGANIGLEQSHCETV